MRARFKWRGATSLRATVPSNQSLSQPYFSIISKEYQTRGVSAMCVGVLPHALYRSRQNLNVLRARYRPDPNTFPTCQLGAVMSAPGHESGSHVTPVCDPSLVHTCRTQIRLRTLRHYQPPYALCTSCVRLGLRRNIGSSNYPTNSSVTKKAPGLPLVTINGDTTVLPS